MSLTVLEALNNVLCLGPLVIGVWLAFSILRFPDLTVQGAFGLGAASFVVAATALHERGVPQLASLLVALVCASASGALAGGATGAANVALRVPTLLCGLAVSMVCYSVSLLVMGSPTRDLPPAFSPDAMLGLTRPVLPEMGLEERIAVLVSRAGAETLLLWCVVVLLGLGVHLVLTSRIGLFVRASGGNPAACQRHSLPHRSWLCAGLALANACAALSGALFAQHVRFSDVHFGASTVAPGLGAVILAEAFRKPSSTWTARLFRLLLALSVFEIVRVAVLRSPIGSDYLRLVEGALLVAAVAISRVVARRPVLADLRL